LVFKREFAGVGAGNTNPNKSVPRQTSLMRHVYSVGVLF